jgi:hypothetical protein
MLLREKIFAESGVGGHIPLLLGMYPKPIKVNKRIKNKENKNQVKTEEKRGKRMGYISS